MVILCASQASTAICKSLSMDIEASSSSSSTCSTTQALGGRAIDRHNPIIRDGRRSAPCSSQSQLPINPKSYQQLQKSSDSNSSNSKPNDKKTNKSSSSSSSKLQNDQNQKRKSSQAFRVLGDYMKPSSSSNDVNIDGSRGRNQSWGKAKAKAAAAAATPPAPGSSRYLLSDADADECDPVLALVALGNNNKSTQLAAAKHDDYSFSSKPSSSNQLQVVVLRVSLHCKGCEGKVRKHLSRMEGVSSFNIDFAAKKVTVVGDVTPLSVLASISKVKNAQFWTSATATATVNKH